MFKIYHDICSVFLRFLIIFYYLKLIFLMEFLVSTKDFSLYFMVLCFLDLVGGEIMAGPYNLAAAYSTVALGACRGEGVYGLVLHNYIICLKKIRRDNYIIWFSAIILI